MLDEQGFPVGGRGGVHRLDMQVVGWGREPSLVLSVDLDDPLTCSDMGANLDVAAAVHRFVQSVDVAFGHIGRSSNDQTEIERCFPWQTFTSDPYNPSAGSRRILRGYSWVTIEAKEVAPKLSPAPGVTVEALPSGAVWLQAGPDPTQYDGARIESMWRSVAGALPPGEPTNIEMARLEHQRSTGIKVHALHVQHATLHETIMRPASDALEPGRADPP